MGFHIHLVSVILNKLLTSQSWICQVLGRVCTFSVYINTVYHVKITYLNFQPRKFSFEQLGWLLLPNHKSKDLQVIICPQLLNWNAPDCSHILWCYLALLWSCDEFNCSAVDKFVLFDYIYIDCVPQSEKNSSSIVFMLLTKCYLKYAYRIPSVEQWWEWRITLALHFPVC